MQVPAGDIHVLGPPGIVELPQLPGKAPSMRRLDPSLDPRLEEPLHALVPKAPYHPTSV